jgi:hypothetical protein
MSITSKHELNGARTRKSGTTPTDNPSKDGRVRAEGTKMIGGYFYPEVRSALLLVKAQPQNVGRTLNDLLGEAINALCAKYNVTPPYHSPISNNLYISPPPPASRSAIQKTCSKKR